MTALLEVSVHYPTFVFTVLLGVCAIYWVLVIVGALGMDVLDGDVDAPEAAEMVADGGVQESRMPLGVLSVLGLRRVPATLVVSLVVFWSWFFCHLGAHFLLGEAAGFWSESAVLVGAFALAFPATALCVRPLAVLLPIERSPSRRDLVGKVVRISTSRVDEAFGAATADDGGAGLIVQVRCTTPNTMTRGDEAIVVTFDVERGTYEVAPMMVSDASGQR